MTTKTTLSQSAEAVKKRKLRAEATADKKKAKAKAKKAAAEESQLDPSGPDAGGKMTGTKPSTATIGVQTPAKATAKTKQLYHCPNCDQDVTVAMAECPICGEIFNWPKE